MRDALTLFDENAALLVLPKSAQDLYQALCAHEWQTIFVEQRVRFLSQVEVWCFGHALMEKLLQPYKAICAHSYVLWVDEGFGAQTQQQKLKQIDAQLAQRILQKPPSKSDFQPLPILGIPNWWPEQDQNFYADAKVFRAKRQANVPLGG